jgi:predicted nucleic acid-binding protein
MTMDAETIFIDTNILVYATDDESPFQAKSLGMLKQLMADGIDFAISPQIVREYLVVLTRGLSPDDPARSAALHNAKNFLRYSRCWMKTANLLPDCKRSWKSPL